MNKLKALLPLASMLVFFGCSQRAPMPPQELKEPDLALTELVSGSTKTLADFKGKTLIVDFWASWCPPCLEAMPALSKLSKDFESKNVQVIGISSEKKEAAQHAIDRKKPSYPIYLDTTDASNLKFNLQGLPTVVIIDPKGNVVYNEEGPSIDVVRSELNKVLHH